MSTTQDTYTEQDVQRNKINSATFFVACLTMLSRLLGFVRIGVISAFFGAGGFADVLNLVLSIPNNLRKLFAEGAFHNAFMPSYASAVDSNTVATKKSSHLLFDLSVWGGMVILLLVVLLSYYSDVVTGFLFDLQGDDQQRLAREMFSWVIFFLIMMTFASMLSGLLHTHKKFVVPALSPIVMSLTTILVVVFLAQEFNIFSVVYGYLLGGLLQIVILAIPLYRLGYHFTSVFLQRELLKTSMFSPEFKKVLKRLPPIVLAVILPMVGQQVAFYFSSTLPEGSSSSFSYAIVFWQLPIGVFINSTVAVAYAFLLSYIHKNDASHVHQCIVQAIEKMVLFLIPISIMFYFFADAGVAVALQRGKMTSEATLLTAKVLQGYALGLLPMGLYIFFQRVFYAYQKNVVVLLYALLFTLVDIIVSYLLIKTPLQVVGLSYAYTISLLCVVPIMYIHIRKISKVNIKSIPFGKILLSLIPLGVVSWILSFFTSNYWIEGSTIENILRFIVVSFLLLTILMIGYATMGINIFKKIRNR